MGTYLFAKKKEGVSALALFNATYNESISQDRYEYYLSKKAELSNNDDAWFNWLYESGNEDLNDFNRFELFGFRKYKRPLTKHLDENDWLPPCGGESDHTQIEYMCILNDIEYDNIKDLIDELYWC